MAGAGADDAAPATGVGGTSEALAGEPEAGGVPIAEYDALLHEFICWHMFECCTEAEMAFLAAALESFTPESCYAWFATNDATLLAVSEANGRIQYDPQVAAAYFAALYEAGCSEPAAQDDGITPLVEIGGACSSHRDCVTGVCYGVSWLPADPACAEPRQVGEACGEDGECGSEFCGDGICAAKKLEGETCYTSAHCIEGSCDQSLSYPGRCVNVETACPL